MASEAFLRNYPGYRSAADARYERSNRYTPEGYRRSDGRRKVDARIEGGGKRMGGLDEFYALQRGARAFQDPRFPGQSAREVAQDMRRRGETTSFGGRDIVPDTGRPQTDQSRGGGFRRFREPTSDQRRWSQKFAETQVPKPPVPSATDDTPGAASTKARQDFLQKYKMVPQGAPASSAPASGPSAPNFSRSALVQGAKASGDFAGERNKFNTGAVGTGNRMDDMGSIKPLSKQGDMSPGGTSPYARDKFGAAAEDIAARRDFARGEAPVQRTPAGTKEDPWASTATKANPYGTATATFGGPPRTSGGTMTDPLTGKQVPMKGYLAQQSAVQDTKYGKMPTAAEYAQGKTGVDTGTVGGSGFYDPKKIRGSLSKKGAV